MNSNYTAGGIRLDANGAGSQYENRYRMFIYTNYIRGVSFAMKLQSAAASPSRRTKIFTSTATAA